jgi:hypothetical protein
MSKLVWLPLLYKCYTMVFQKLFCIVCLGVCLNMGCANAQIVQGIANQMRNTPSRITDDARLQKGHVYVNAGIGFPNLFFEASDLASELSGFFEIQKKGFLTTHATIEYMIKNNLGIGLLLGYAQGEYRYASKTNSKDYLGFKGSFYNIGITSTYHFFANKNWDVYTGAMLVYNGRNIKPTGNANIGYTIPIINVYVSVADLISKPTSPDLLYQVSIGARAYPFKDKPIGIFVEGGYGITIVKTGLTIKI